MVFTSAGTYRDVVFRGLAVPGAEGLSQNEDLVAVWKIAKGDRFQNYRAKFTILDVPSVPRKWLDDLIAGDEALDNSPPNWEKWVRTGAYTPICAVRSIEIRSKTEQLPENSIENLMLDTILEYFSEHPIKFESCAAEIVRQALSNVTTVDLTRPTRDGGRDALGKYQIGSGAASILIDFAIEAKCWAPTSPDYSRCSVKRSVSVD